MLFLTVGPEDYTQIQDYPITFFAGSEIGTTMCVNITIEDDDIVEPDQQFFVTLDSTSDNPVFFYPYSSATVVIGDNDGQFIVYSRSDDHSTVHSLKLLLFSTWSRVESDIIHC